MLEFDDELRKYWTFILYPDSLPRSWVSMLAIDFPSVIISPLHDKDVGRDGKPLPPHYHVIVSFHGTRDQVFDYISNFFQVEIVQSISDDGLPVSIRYLCHLDHPHKHQYPTSEVKGYGNFNYKKYLSDKFDYRYFMRTKNLLSELKFSFSNIKEELTYVLYITRCLGRVRFKRDERQSDRND